jgi:transcriptional regulator with XRE-family HTH domain
MEEQERRQVLAAFLRSRRARLTPAEVGLADGIRRRTPGLRREEVAQLAHIGVSWYTSLEQGRDVKPSEQVLDSLAKALRLNAGERRHLFTLARVQPPYMPPAPEEVAGPALERMVQALEPHPAYVLGRRWDLLAWNRTADAVFGLSRIPGPHSRNMLWRGFTTVHLKQNPDGLRIAKGVVAQFRADYARYPGDPSFERLITDLQSVSPDFARLWSEHDVVMDPPDCRKTIEHPHLGRMEFDYVTLQTADGSGLKTVVYTAVPEAAEKLRQLLAGVSVSAASD